MAASPSKSPSSGARIAAVVVLGILGFFVFAPGSSEPTAPVTEPDMAASSDDPDTITPPGTPPAADVAALLDGLSLGNDFEGWKIVNFWPAPEKILWIEFGKDRTFFSVSITAKREGNPLPPEQTDLYDVGYGLVRPKSAAIAQDVQMRIVAQIAARVRKREKEVGRPKAL
ncbi:MAG TPA: hypothetical protein PKA58_28995 [Polyangium sp.]|nr:hypothetical protein [Polyangium sp.]